MGNIFNDLNSGNEAEIRETEHIIRRARFCIEIRGCRVEIHTPPQIVIQKTRYGYKKE